MDCVRQFSVPEQSEVRVKTAGPHGHTAEGEPFPQAAFFSCFPIEPDKPALSRGCSQKLFFSPAGNPAAPKNRFSSLPDSRVARKFLFAPPAFADRSENPFLTLPTSRQAQKRLFCRSRIPGCLRKPFFTLPGFAGRSEKAFLTHIPRNSSRNTLVLNNLQSN